MIPALASSVHPIFCLQLYNLVLQGLQDAVSDANAVLPGVAQALTELLPGLALLTEHSHRPTSPTVAKLADLDTLRKLNQCDVAVLGVPAADAFVSNSNLPGQLAQGALRHGVANAYAQNVQKDTTHVHSVYVQRKRANKEGKSRVCENCGVTDTPYWRKERSSGRLVCNACGLYAAKNDHPRPVRLWREGQILPNGVVMNGSANALCIKQTDRSPPASLTASRNNEMASTAAEHDDSKERTVTPPMTEVTAMGVVEDFPAGNAEGGEEPAKQSDDEKQGIDNHDSIEKDAVGVIELGADARIILMATYGEDCDDRRCDYIAADQPKDGLSMSYQGDADNIANTTKLMKT